MRRIGIPLTVISITLIIGIYYGYSSSKQLTVNGETTTTSTTGTKASFHYYFKVNGALEEKGSMSESSSPYFWLNSGGRMLIEDGIGKTVQGKLPATDYWRTLYGRTNPLDTDNGYHPQNLLRLITKSKWDSFEQSIKFKIQATNLTDTPNRGGWSGVLMMSRYQDGYNLYYAGVRMDGTAVIKKKYKGVYYTLASGSAFKSATSYNKETNPNLIPQGTWMGMKTTTVTNADGSVVVKLFIDRNNSGTWEQLITATDKPGVNGSGVVTGPAYAGIRTDYMDVVFDDYDLKSY